MPVDINRLTEGWLELESDPGLFTLLLEDFGVKGVQVEEIYDLQKSLEGPVYGFIFLFRWIEERRSRRKIVDQSDIFVKDEEVVNNIFFAQQVVPNSCATHALLSVLLNCPNIHLGATLSRLKAHTSGMCPENKGWAIGNSPELAKAHNSHAMPQAKWCSDKTTGVSTARYTGEAFHFVSYVPIHGRLFELDGLKPYPMDHGPWGEKEDWTEKFRRVITDRLGMATGEPYHDIRFNLMAVVPDRRLTLVHKLKMLKTNRQIVLDALQQLVKLTSQPNDEKVDASAVNDNETAEKNSKQEEDSYETQNYIKPATGTLCPADYSTPLTIQTSPAPSGSSTDTSSEVGSAFNSPTQGWGWNSGQSSPTSSKEFKKFVVIGVSGSNESSTAAKRLSSDVSAASTKRICLETGQWEKDVDKSGTDDGNSDEKKEESNKTCSKYPELFEPHTFAPKDLFALLKNLENEISVCELNLRDENEKRKKYKIDDCRRTHNYDEFICTFLQMLAEQGKLADLVQQHLLLHKKPGIPVARVQRTVKKVEAKPSPSRRRRGRTNYRKRK